MISFLVFSAGMARDIRSKKPVPAKPWKKLISAEKTNFSHFVHLISVSSKKYEASYFLKRGEVL